mmetsp:Transcript_26623/g.74732  ORF Transcript_26623/g.74732 Transcript_26623/m.74732 type:complete len:201 (-) Transcript_26623:873-1475(-)
MIMSRQIHPPALPSSPSSSPPVIAPATTLADFSSFVTRAWALMRSSLLLTRMTPREAAPWMGFRTDGKPTRFAASSIWLASLISMFFGVGSPAFSITARVLCLLRALSTAVHELPRKSKTSQRRDARGTAISQKVRMPSTSPISSFTVLMAATHASKLASISEKSTGMNFSITPASTRPLLQLSAESRMTVRQPSSLARS